MSASVNKPTRIILEMGTGSDLYGEDYTKAACRAVRDAIHHSSLSFFKTLGLDPNAMEIDLNIAAQKPEMVDLAAVAAELPYGKITPRATKGGLNVPDKATGRIGVIVNVGISVRLAIREVDPA